MPLIILLYFYKKYNKTCFMCYYAHHQKLATMMLITTLAVSFCKDGGVSVNVNLWFLVVCVRCEVVCRELLMKGIVVPETCWAYKKYNKIMSDI